MKTEHGVGEEHTYSIMQRRKKREALDKSQQAKERDRNKAIDDAVAGCPAVISRTVIIFSICGSGLCQTLEETGARAVKASHLHIVGHTMPCIYLT